MLLIASCTKDESSIPEFYNGVATGKINGVEFEFKPRMTHSIGNDSTFNLIINYIIGDNVLRKSISITYIRKTIETQKFNRNVFENKFDLQCKYLTWILDGDVPGNSYELIENDTIADYIQLISYDEKTGKVLGKFQGSFMVDTTHIFDPNSPNDLVITDGYFETTIFK